MTSSSDLKLYTWADGNFTYSLNPSNAHTPIFTTNNTITNAAAGNLGEVNTAIAAWSNVADIHFTVNNTSPDIGFYDASFTNDEVLFERDVIERQLAHQERNRVRAAYDHAEHLPARRKMMEWWGDYLDEATNNVIVANFAKAG